MARLFNTQIGLAIRDIARQGTTIPRINRRRLEDVPFFLPTQENQRRVVKAQNNITRLKTGLGELEDKLWSKPAQVSSIENQISNFGREDRFDDWVETLPFPIASVLWRYHAMKKKSSSKESSEHLLAFFEVLAEFCAIVHLSAFYQNESRWPSVIEGLSHALGKHNLSFERSTFGTWISCFAYLSKRTRKLMEEEEAICVRMYRTRNLDLLRMLTSRKVSSALQAANEIRNSQLAHVGAVSERVANRTLEGLEQHLQTIRTVFGYYWVEYKLLKPLQCRMSRKIFSYTALSITGTKSMPFPSTKVELTEPMEDGRLHLWGRGENTTLLLLPLVKIMESPRTSDNACYLYNRIDSDGIRFLSYHFENDADIVQPFVDTADLLEELSSFSPDLGQGT